MKEKKIFIFSIVIFICLAVVIVFIVYFNSLKISCENEIDRECFAKHFEKCEPDFISVQGESLDGFHTPVAFSMEILKKDGKNCVVNYTVTNVSHPGETWAIGKNAECYLPYKNPVDYLKKDLIAQYSENCDGSLAEGIKENCYVFGNSTSGGVTKKTYLCDLPEKNLFLRQIAHLIQKIFVID